MYLLPMGKKNVPKKFCKDTQGNFRNKDNKWLYLVNVY